MCGLVGIYDFTPNGMYKRDADIFYVMLLLNSLRGMHSTGTLGIAKNGEMDFFKTMGGAESFMQYKEADKFMMRIPQRYHTVFGHGRFATKGNMDAHTAHPFVRNNTGMIHNGTMYNYETLAKGLYPEQKFYSDSDFCSQVIEDDGLESLMKMYSGGYALMTFNKEKNQIQVARNEGRPLFFFQCGFARQWLFSSEEEVFIYLQAKFNIKGKILHAAPNNIYSFTIGEEQYSKEEVVMKTQHTSGWHNEGQDWTDGYESVVPPRQMPMPPMPRKANNVIPLRSTNVIAGAATSYKLGETLTFAMKDYDQRTLASGKLGTWIDGELTTNSPAGSGVSIVGLYYGVVEDVYEEELLTGTITEILALDEIKTNFHTRIFVNNIKGFKNTIQQVETKTDNLIINEQNARVELADGSTIAEWRFKELILQGCGLCQAKFTTPPNPKTCTLVPNPKGAMLGIPVLSCTICTANNAFNKAKGLEYEQGQMH